MKEFSDKYLGLLTGKYKDLNLTRIMEPEEFFNKQVVDSLIPTDEIGFISKLYADAKVCVDVGFGGGFPILPLAKKYPGKRFYGFEARRKKAEAVQDIAKELGLDNVTTHHNRIETILLDKDVVVSFKAVGKIEEFLKKINASKKCHVVFYKGPKLYELEKVPSSCNGFKKIFEKAYDVVGTDGRNIVVYEKTNVPRGTKNSLVKLSAL